MNRRHFIKNTGMAGLALGMSPTFIDVIKGFDNQLDIEPFFKLSLAQWSLHKQIWDKALHPLDFAQKAKSLGFEAVEYVNQLYNDEVAKSSLNTVVKELKKRSKDLGMTNVLIMIDGEGDLAAATKQGRDEAIALHSKWVDAAAELGCKSIRVNLFGDAVNNDFAKWKGVSADGLGRLAQYAAKSNINVMVENHGGISSDAGKLTEVIKAIGLKNCGTLPDFGNFCMKRQGGERWGAPCIDEYDKYKGVLEMMPFAHGVSAKTFDFDNQGNETTIDYFKMLKIVKEADYKGYIGIEYEGERLTEEQGIAATKALLLKVASAL
jgi:sugar phosphate isomerase/epimerase